MRSWLKKNHPKETLADLGWNELKHKAPKVVISNMEEAKKFLDTLKGH